MSINIIEVSTELVSKRYLSFAIRYYGGWNWGFRCLGGPRYALDCGLLSLIFERYSR